MWRSWTARRDVSRSRWSDARVRPAATRSDRKRAARVADQLARLSSDYREVLVLRNLEGLPFSEVALRMGRSAGAVRILWVRAVDQLRQLLQAEEFV